MDLDWNRMGDFLGDRALVLELGLVAPSLVDRSPVGKVGSNKRTGGNNVMCVHVPYSRGPRLLGRLWA